ncbi:MAG TPA: hypothetical protein VJS15_10555 [Allosphingosinicella sp.]|nr:hypothetical protein [Allosphingosinicella sp.]
MGWAPPARADPARSDASDDPACANDPRTASCLVGRRGTAAEPCFALRGYLDDRIPGGRAVHAAPDLGSPILGRIAEPWPDGDIAVGFDIMESRDGWLRIEGARDNGELTGAAERDMYHGAGWIRGHRVSVSAQASQALAEPRFESPITLRSVGIGDELQGYAEMNGILACDGLSGDRPGRR